MVPKVGFEPTQAYAYGALNTACLPIPPLRHVKNSLAQEFTVYNRFWLQRTSVSQGPGVSSGSNTLRLTTNGRCPDKPRHAVNPEGIEPALSRWVPSCELCAFARRRPALHSSAPRLPRSRCWLNLHRDSHLAGCVIELLPLAY